MGQRFLIRKQNNDIFKVLKEQNYQLREEKKKELSTQNSIYSETSFRNEGEVNEK